MTTVNPTAQSSFRERLTTVLHVAQQMTPALCTVRSKKAVLGSSVQHATHTDLHSALVGKVAWHAHFEHLKLQFKRSENCQIPADGRILTFFQIFKITF
jgi:hypothetical protein